MVNQASIFLMLSFLILRIIERRISGVIDGFKRADLLINGENYRYLEDTSRRAFFTPNDPEVQDMEDSTNDTEVSPMEDDPATIPVASATPGTMASHSSYTPILQKDDT